MTWSEAGPWLILAGSVVFALGVSPVPRVFTTTDPAERLQMLQARRTQWFVGQFAVIDGTVLAAVGVLLLDHAEATFAAGLALLIGALAWIPGLIRRGRDIEGFAYQRHPAWPFYTYTAASLLGLLLLALGLSQEGPVWLAWVVTLAAAAFGGLLVMTRDLPPFVFYVVLDAVAITLLL